MERITGQQQAELHDQVGRVLCGRSTLDEFVRWVGRSRWQGSDVGVALAHMTNGDMGVDELYIYLARWHRLQSAVPQATNYARNLVAA